MGGLHVLKRKDLKVIVDFIRENIKDGEDVPHYLFYNNVIEYAKEKNECYNHLTQTLITRTIKRLGFILKRSSSQSNLKSYYFYRVNHFTTI